MQTHNLTPLQKRFYEAYLLRVRAKHKEAYGNDVRFMASYLPCLAYVVTLDASYSTTSMTPAVKGVCKELGIKSTKKGLAAALNGTPV